MGQQICNNWIKTKVYRDISTYFDQNIFCLFHHPQDRKVGPVITTEIYKYYYLLDFCGHYLDRDLWYNFACAQCAASKKNTE